MATKSIEGLRHSIGYLRLAPGEVVFVTRRLFRERTYRIPLREVVEARRKAGLLLDELCILVRKWTPPRYPPA